MDPDFFYNEDCAQYFFQSKHNPINYLKSFHQNYLKLLRGKLNKQLSNKRLNIIIYSYLFFWNHGMLQFRVWTKLTIGIIFLKQKMQTN